MDLLEEDREIDEVYLVLEMAEGVLFKFDVVFKKLDAMEIKFDSFEGYVKNVDVKVNALITKVEILESIIRNVMKFIEELDKGMVFLNSEVE